MSGNRWDQVDPDLFVKKSDGTCDLPKSLTAQTKKKRSKYGNTTMQDPQYGFFHSKGEQRRWYDLLWLQQAELITELSRQVPYVMCDAEEVNGLQLHKITYIADFQYVEDEQLIVEDYKSKYTVNLKEWRLKKALFIYRYPEIILRETIQQG